MTYDDCIIRIDRYINSDRHSPIIVDIPNATCWKRLLRHYNVEGNEIVRAESFSNGDSLPMIATIKDDLSRSKNIVFLTGLTMYLSLHGKDTLTNELVSLLNMRTNGKIIVLSFACRNALEMLDKRMFDAARIMIMDGECNKMPILRFISPKLPSPKLFLIGIHQLPKAIDRIENESEISIITERSKKDYPNSEFEIRDCTSNFQVLSGRFPELEKIGEEAGKESDWDSLLNDKILECKSWLEYANKKLHIHNLSTEIRHFDKFSELEKWVYFLALKTCGVKGNDYLSNVAIKSATFEDFIEKCFFLILTYDIRNEKFWDIYNERKGILGCMQEYSDVVRNFCIFVNSKGRDALYYMTDLCTEEKEKTIDLLAKYADEYKKEEVITVINRTYPDLASYLSPYYSGNKELDDYIEQYKYCKITNRISSEFEEKVNHQATAHQFLTWLQPRSSRIDALLRSMDTDKSELYFMDALGVEFLGFLQNKCMEQGLMFHAEIVRCELPSITSINKGFVGEFKNAGCKTHEDRRIDSLKHEGNASYNFENTKTPIHIVKELEILNDLIHQLKTIKSDTTAYVISDHGATRLAVIKEHENKWEVVEKAKHSGRCCPKTDLKDKPDFAVEDNGFWCIANYDRFRGGRKAAVEVHGGATMEEVAVPIISINKMVGKIQCLLKEDKPITTSFKKKAMLELLINVESDEIGVTVNGKFYAATRMSAGNRYLVTMPDIKKSGTYSLNVYLKDALICKGLTFEVKNEGVSERKFF